MGALKGSLSYRRFYTRHDTPVPETAELIEKAAFRVFQELATDSEEAETSGWVCCHDPFDLELNHHSVLFNNHVNLGLRTDKWVIPAPLLKAHLAKAEREYCEKEGIEKLGKSAKSNLKDMVSLRLRSQLTPTMKVVDVCWNLDSGLVRFWNHSEKGMDMLQAFFEETWGVKLVPEAAATLADRLGLSAAEKSAFEELEPLDVVG